MGIEAQPYDSWFESRWGSYAFGIQPRGWICWI